MGYQGEYSPDGRWWWDGYRWIPVPPPGGVLYPQQLIAYAGFWIRFFAWFIDWVVLGVAGVVIGFVLGVMAALLGFRAGLGVIAYGLAILVGWLYYSLSHSSRAQASLGMMAAGLSVVGADGMRIGFGRATGRYFASLLSWLLCYVGYLMIAFTARRQGLHDLIASTHVVRARPRPGQALIATYGGPANMAAGVTAAVAVIAILLLTSVLVIVILLTMGGQIKNVFSNVVVALNS